MFHMFVQEYTTSQITFIPIAAVQLSKYEIQAEMSFLPL